MFIYIHSYLLNLEDYLDRLLEHQYKSTPASYLYRACWFLYLPSLGDQCPFLTHQYNSIFGDLC